MNEAHNHYDSQSFKLFAFYANPATLSELIRNDVDGVVIDWERKGKDLRQQLYDTQISEHQSDDLRKVQQEKPKCIVCRINAFHADSISEINLAIACGANEILLPMVTKTKEVEQVIELANGRVKVGVMLETIEALAIAQELNDLPVHRFYVGLNDLAIQRGTRNIFLPFIDGLLDELRPKITRDFGVGGLTHPSLGNPIPCRYLIDRMKYYQCSFAFLRRSFYRDLNQFSMEDIFSALSKEFSGEVKEVHWDQEAQKLFNLALI